MLDDLIDGSVKLHHGSCCLTIGCDPNAILVLHLKDICHLPQLVGDDLVT